MKRLLLSFVLLLAATGATAQSRDVLLTPDGTLYTVEVASSEASAMGGQLYLQITARQGKTVTTTNVPESMNGLNLRPALAYDDDSKTLFVLWLHRGQNSLSNELNLASYHDGKWQPAVAIDSHASWGEVRLNLRIGITRRVSQLQKDGTYADVPALLVHAVWWEDNSVDGEGARYALIPIDKGNVGIIDVHALREFTDPATTPAAVNDDFNRDFLRHPTMIESSTSTTVDVLFGDLRTNTVNRVTLKPVADSRVHIPGGIHGGRPIGAPRALSTDWSGHVTTIDGREGRTMFVNTTAASVSYITYANGSWTPVKSVATDDKFTADAALAALAKMLASE